MASDFMRKLEAAGKLRKQAAGFVQVEALLKEAIIDITEAKRIVDIAERATYLLAYNAMLKAGRALVLFKGYRPVDGAQHKTVVDVTADILGEPFRDLTNHFEMMRRKRHDLTYEPGSLLSQKEVVLAFEDAKRMISQILKEVKTKNPQMEINWP